MRARNDKAPNSRTIGPEWERRKNVVTHRSSASPPFRPMRERALAEALRLGAGRFTLDRSLTLALLRSANGWLESRARAKAMLDAQERAAMERDRQAALARKELTERLNRHGLEERETSITGKLARPCSLP